MQCENIHDLLSPYLDDELSIEERDLVDRHLLQCTDCAALFAFLKDTHEGLADFPELEPSRELLAKIYEIPSRPRLFSLKFFLKPSLQPVFTAATMLMILGSFYFFHPDRARINNAINRNLHIGYAKIERLYAHAEAFTTSLGKYKDDFLVSLERFNPFHKSEKQE